jgi:hypothetical protein
MIREGEDINQKSNSYTPLWCAISGMLARSLKPTNLADYDMVQLLLTNGANPNTKCMLIPPLFRAALEGEHDIVVELLVHGADPNDYAMIKCNMTQNPNGVAMCKTPIVVAVEESEPAVVDALIQYGAVYNKCLINRFKTDLEKLHRKKHKSYADWFYYKLAKRVVTLLEDNYDESMEEEVEKIKQKNDKTGNRIKNHFMYFGPQVWAD